MSVVLRRFIAGFLATLIFHQGVMAALWVAKVIPRAPFLMTPVAPLGVPSVISLAFWGGVWGVLLLSFVNRLLPKFQWPAAVLLGAIGPTLVALFVVMPLKGMPQASLATLLVLGCIINGVWGAGALLIARLISRNALRAVPV